MLDIMGESTRRRERSPEDGKELMLGNFFKPSSPSFLGGNSPVGTIGKAALSIFQPELAPYIYGASAVGDAIQGNWVGAAGNALASYGAGGGFNDNSGGFSFSNGANGTFAQAGQALSNFGTSASNWASDLWNGGSPFSSPQGFSGDFGLNGVQDFSGVSNGMGGYDPDYLRKAGMLQGPGTAGGMLAPGAAATLSSGGFPSSYAGGGSPFSGAKAINSLSSIGSGLYGMYNANQMRGMASTAMNRADPWGASGGRGVADQQLQALLRDPTGAAANDPAFQLRIQAAMRANAPMGTDSGAMATAAANASTDWYNGRLQQLGGISGAGVNPGTAAEIGVQGTNYANTLAGQSLASIGFGLNTATGGTAGANVPANVRAWLQSQGINI